MLEMNQIHCMNCIDGLKHMDSESVNCCVTSPPYWGLRDYGVEGQLGLESTPEEYVAKMVEVFGEIKRVLRDDGTLWLNLGDSYAGSGKGAANYPENAAKYKQGTNKGTVGASAITKVKFDGYKPKDLVGIPWMVAFALRADGWYLRQDIVWAKTNPMPESVQDRCTKSHEYIFLLSKSQKYYYSYKAIREKTLTKDNLLRNRDTTKLNNVPGRTKMGGLKTNNYEFRNKRSVWTVSTQPFSEAHFATFPPKLIEPCILAGCPKDGIVLDPFMGSGTTAMVALQLQRNFIGFELNPDYVKIAEKHRLANVQQRIV